VPELDPGLAAAIRALSPRRRLFVYEVPESHWRAGHRPTALILVDADGEELARSEAHLNDFLRAVESTRSVEH